MLAYKILFTVTQSLFVILTFLAVVTDSRKNERHKSFLAMVYFMIISSIGCIWGMWL